METKQPPEINQAAGFVVRNRPSEAKPSPNYYPTKAGVSGGGEGISCKAIRIYNCERNGQNCTRRMKTNVRKYAAEEETLKQGMEAKSKEFVEKGAEVYK